ncbi:MAG: hypothetical protein II852_09725 [Bacteroidales bacterium]|nr:hypothetical protein [Bacteroidales bacterium]
MDIIEIINLLGSVVTIGGAVVSVYHARKSKKYNDMTTDKYRLIEYHHLIENLNDLVSALDNWTIPSSVKRGLSREDTCKSINGFVSKLGEVKSKMKDNTELEKKYEHLSTLNYAFADCGGVDEKKSVNIARELQTNLRSIKNIFVKLID